MTLAFSSGMFFEKNIDKILPLQKLPEGAYAHIDYSKALPRMQPQADLEGEQLNDGRVAGVDKCDP